MKNHFISSYGIHIIFTQNTQTGKQQEEYDVIAYDILDADRHSCRSPQAAPIDGQYARASGKTFNTSTLQPAKSSRLF
jgi:hypothetical protein